MEVLLASTHSIAPEGFSAGAMTTYVAQVEEYASDLAELGIRVSKREGADLVSKRDISRAAEFLGTGKGSRWARNIGSAGGVLLGLGLAVIVEVVVHKEYSVLPVAIAFLASLVGLGMTVYDWVRE